MDGYDSRDTRQVTPASDPDDPQSQVADPQLPCAATTTQHPQATSTLRSGKVTRSVTGQPVASLNSTDTDTSTVATSSPTPNVPPKDASAPKKHVISASGIDQTISLPQAPQEIITIPDEEFQEICAGLKPNVSAWNVFQRTATVQGILESNPVKKELKEFNTSISEQWSALPETEKKRLADVATRHRDQEQFRYIVDQKAR